MPSPAICDRWNADDAPGTLSDIMQWCRIAGPLQAGLLAALDSEPDEPHRVLTMTTEESAKELIGQVKVGEAAAAPNTMQSAKLRLFFAAAWHAGRGSTSTSGSAIAPTSTTLVVPNPTELQADMADVVSMNGVLTQVGNTLVRLMSVPEYDALFPVFGKQCAGPMLEGQEPSIIQVTCYKENERAKKTL